MANRIHHSTQRGVLDLCGLRTNHCVAVAVATALSSDPEDTREVAERMPDVISRLQQTGFFKRGGSWYGDCTLAARVNGLKGVREDSRANPGYDTSWTSGRRGRRTRDALPTMAQWERRHRGVKRALICGTGHLGYFERDADGTAHVFNMGARKRVGYAVVLERVGDAPEPEPEQKPERETPGPGTAMQKQADGSYLTANGRFKAERVELAGSTRRWSVVDLEEASRLIYERTLEGCRWAVRQWLDDDEERDW